LSLSVNLLISSIFLSLKNILLLRKCPKHEGRVVAATAESHSGGESLAMLNK
jgi:hypothetical protein